MFAACVTSSTVLLLYTGTYRLAVLLQNGLVPDLSITPLVHFDMVHVLA